MGGQAGYFCLEAARGGIDFTVGLQEGDPEYALGSETLVEEEASQHQ